MGTRVSLYRIVGELLGARVVWVYIVVELYGFI